MSFVTGIIVLIFVYRFWGSLRNAEQASKTAINSGLNALVKGAAKLEATTPNLTESELSTIAEGRKQIRILESLNEMSEEELLTYFKSETKTKKK